MKKSMTIIAYVCIGLFALSLLYISILAWVDPKAVMAFVGVALPNNDALSSIRGVYGGVGIFLVAVSVIVSIRNVQNGLLFFTAFWWMYAISRILTIGMDGSLGEFGSTWLKIELTFGLLAFVLYLLQRYVLKKKDFTS